MNATLPRKRWSIETVLVMVSLDKSKFVFVQPRSTLSLCCLLVPIQNVVVENMAKFGVCRQ